MFEFLPAAVRVTILLFSSLRLIFFGYWFLLWGIYFYIQKSLPQMQLDLSLSVDVYYFLFKLSRMFFLRTVTVVVFVVILVVAALLTQYFRCVARFSQLTIFWYYFHLCHYNLASLESLIFLKDRISSLHV